MGNASTLSIILDYVKSNPMQTATQISRATGINLLTVHRQLSGGYKKISAGTFTRVKVTRALPPNKDGRIRGSFCYLYSVNPNYKKESKEIVPKKAINRDPITSAWFGALA
jgi:hypothetical protein